MLRIFSRRRKRQSPANQRHYLQHREQARTVITQRVEYFAQKYGFTYNRIAIKNTRSRWGSCSSKGNLNFNYRLLFLSAELRDYVVIHELCHLREMNHSSRFWAQVEAIMPEYKTHRAALHAIPLNIQNPKQCNPTAGCDI